MSPTNWITADNDMVSCGHRVRLDDGREGVIIRTTRDWRGWPVIDIDGEPTDVHPAHIAGRAQ